MPSTPVSRRCRLATSFGSNEESRSRGTEISTGPVSVSTVLARWPLRELPPLRPAGSFFSYPRWSSSSPSRAPSTTILVSLPNSPPSPVSFSPPERARSVSSSSSCSSAAVSSTLWSCPFVTSVTGVSLLVRSYTVEITVPTGAAGRADYLFSRAACRDTERRGMVLTRRGRLDGRSVSALCLSGLVVQLPLLKLVAFSDCARLRIGRARPRRRPDARGLHESVLLHNGSAVRPCRLPAK